MLDIKPNTLEQLRVILKEDFKQEVTTQELHDIAFHLVGFFDSMMQFYSERIFDEHRQKLEASKQKTKLKQEKTHAQHAI